MRIIAHRGNLYGPNILSENDPKQIQKALSMGFEVEVDTWGIKRHQEFDTWGKATNFYNVFTFGHDEIEYTVKMEEFEQMKLDNGKVWFHAKSVAAFLELNKKLNSANLFFHNAEEATLTSFGYVWLYPGVEKHKSENFETAVCVLPELTYGKKISNWDLRTMKRMTAVCTDYPVQLKEEMERQKLV